MKLFEIPVYGLTKEVLKKRVEERRMRSTGNMCAKMTSTFTASTSVLSM